MYEYEKKSCSYTCESKQDMLYAAEKIIDFLCADVGLDISQKISSYVHDHYEVEFTLTVCSTEPEDYPANDIELFNVVCCSCCKKKKVLKRNNLQKFVCHCCKKEYSLCEHCSYHQFTEYVLENPEQADMATTKFCSINCVTTDEIAPKFHDEGGEA